MTTTSAHYGQISTLTTARVLARDYLIVLGTDITGENLTYARSGLNGAMVLAERMGEAKAHKFLQTVVDRLDELEEELVDGKSIMGGFKRLLEMCQEGAHD